MSITYGNSMSNYDTFELSHCSLRGECRLGKIAGELAVSGTRRRTPGQWPPTPFPARPLRVPRQFSNNTKKNI